MQRVDIGTEAHQAFQSETEARFHLHPEVLVERSSALGNRELISSRVKIQAQEHDPFRVGHPFEQTGSHPPVPGPAWSSDAPRRFRWPSRVHPLQKEQKVAARGDQTRATIDFSRDDKQHLEGLQALGC